MKIIIFKVIKIMKKLKIKIMIIKQLNKKLKNIEQNYKMKLIKLSKKIKLKKKKELKNMKMLLMQLKRKKLKI